MEPALGRRLFRLVVTLEIGIALLVSVALLADPVWARQYSAFVAVTAAVALVAHLVGRPRV
jgi:hypothetical protein